MFEIKVTIDATPGLLAVLSAFLGQPATAKSPKASDGGSAAASKEEGAKIVKAATPVVKADTQTEGKDEVVNEVVPIEKMRAVIVAKKDAGKDAKPVLESFGVKKISDIPEERRAEFVKQVEAL